MIGAANGCYNPYTFLDSPFVLNYFYGFGYGQLFDDAAGTSFATPICHRSHRRADGGKARADGRAVSLVDRQWSRGV
jgi:hypothetical protein